MTLLLDTHVFLWALGEHPALGADAREVIRDPSIDVFLSPVTPWEIEIKRATGKLDIDADYLAAAAESRFAPLAITLAHGIEAGRLPMHHRDPFDRMLVAQARTESLTIVTSDPRIAQYDVAILAP